MTNHVMACEMVIDLGEGLEKVLTFHTEITSDGGYVFHLPDELVALPRNPLYASQIVNVERDPITGGQMIRMPDLHSVFLGFDALKEKWRRELRGEAP